MRSILQSAHPNLVMKTVSSSHSRHSTVWTTALGCKPFMTSIHGNQAIALAEGVDSARVLYKGFWPLIGQASQAIRYTESTAEHVQNRRSSCRAAHGLLRAPENSGKSGAYCLLGSRILATWAWTSSCARHGRDEIPRIAATFTGHTVSKSGMPYSRSTRNVIDIGCGISSRFLDVTCKNVLCESLSTYFL